MITRALVSCAALAALSPAQTNSNLPRGQEPATVTQGLFDNNSNSNVDVGFNQVDICSPKEFLPAAGGFVATSRLVYALFPEVDGNGDVIFQVRRSITGGRTWEAPVTIYTADTAGGEDLNTGDEGTHLYCYENKVYATIQTNAHDKTQIGQTLWCIASDDQGQTWSAPLLVSTGVLFDVDDAVGAASSSGLHLAWEADDPTFTNENLLYSSVDINGGVLSVVVPETALTNYTGQSDVDLPNIDAQDDVVLIAWLDDDASYNSVAPSGNVTVSVHSFDAGATFSTPFVHSGNTPGAFPLAWASPRRPFPRLDLPFGYVFQEDSRLDEDDLWMDRADVDTSTQTFNWSVSGVQCNFTSVGAGTGDIDGISVEARDGIIAIIYRDDSAGIPLDNSNETYMVVDDAFGFEFIAGTATNHTLTGTKANGFGQVEIEIAGNVIATVFEHQPSADDGVLVYSTDRGNTVTADVFTDLGGGGTNSVDIDNEYVAVTLNGDINIIFVDNEAGASTANSTNTSYTTGIKAMNGTYDAASQTFTVVGIDPTLAGTSQAFLMASTGTTPGTDLNAFLNNGTPGSGFFVGLQQDLLWSLLWANPLPYFVPISSTGTATMNNVLNGTAILGLPVYLAAGTLDFSKLPGDVLDPGSFTDPVVQ